MPELIFSCSAELSMKKVLQPRGKMSFDWLFSASLT